MSALVQTTRQPALADLVPGFLKWLEFARERSRNTVLGYGASIKVFLEFCARGDLTYPDDVTFRHLEVYLAWLRQERKATASTANRHLHALRALWRFLRREEITTRDPAADTFTLKEAHRLPRYLTIPQQEKVMEALAADRTFLGRRDHAFIATALFTGCRVGELVTLRLTDVNLADPATLRVIGKGDKQREIPIVPRLIPILRDYLDNVRPKLIWRPVGSLYRDTSKGEKTWRVHYTLKGRGTSLSTGTQRKAEARALLFAPPLAVVESPWVFVHATPQHRDAEPLLIRSAWLLVYRRLEPLVGKIHPHALRHSFASRLRHNGAPLELISEVLGHAQLGTTLIYSHIPTDKRREDLARYLEGKEGA